MGVLWAHTGAIVCIGLNPHGELANKLGKALYQLLNDCVKKSDNNYCPVLTCLATTYIQEM